MMNFSEDRVFNLRKVSDDSVNKKVAALMIAGEEIVGVYKTIRDQVVFTNKRILTVDVQGVTGTRQEIFTLPYKRIQYFGIQTPGFGELIPDAELVISFSDGRTATFEFKGSNDIVAIGKMISFYTLDK